MRRRRSADGQRPREARRPGPDRRRAVVDLAVLVALLTVCATSSCGLQGSAPGDGSVAGPSASSPTGGSSGGPRTSDGRPAPSGSAGASRGDSGDGGSDDGALNTTTATEPTQVDLLGFLRRCEEGVRNWRAAQVDYPSELTVEVGETVPYVAAVDARDTPLPPESAVPGPSATAEPVFVRCEIAARLTAVGDGLTVDSHDSHDSDDWIVRSFTPSGLIRWSWSVTAAEVGTTDLRLELQPAARSEDGDILVSALSTEVSSFFTHTRVAQTPVQGLGRWWTDNWGTVTLIAGGLGAAVLALLRYGQKLVEQVRSLRAAVRRGGNEIIIVRAGDPLPSSGRRFLVERALPAGVARADLAPDGWLRDAAPSKALRRWFRSDPDRWELFRERYAAELDDRTESLRPLFEAARSGVVVLLHDADDREHNHAVVLREYVLQRLDAPARRR